MATQALTYSALTRSDTRPHTISTQTNLDLTRREIHALTTNSETDPAIWRSICHPDIRRPVQTFLFRAMHNSIRVGRFWLHIKNYKTRAKCSHCNSPVEDLEHILTTCPSPERTTIWRAAKRIWPNSLAIWQQPTFGQILGCGSITPPQRRTEQAKDARAGTRPPSPHHYIRVGPPYMGP
ncbi:hypothetical protein OG21DRAFT_1518360 [Imleria badia]|nr:hypothetical protein OG21DRAFT_1518360 [Imleria badia]